MTTYKTLFMNLAKTLSAPFFAAASKIRLPSSKKKIPLPKRQAASWEKQSRPRLPEHIWSME
jgi:hypothetical protein